MADATNLNRGTMSEGAGPPDQNLLTALWSGYCGLINGFLKGQPATALNLPHKGRDYPVVTLNSIDRTAVITGPDGPLTITMVEDHVFSLYRQIATVFGFRIEGVDVARGATPTSQSTAGTRGG